MIDSKLIIFIAIIILGIVLFGHKKKKFLRREETSTEWYARMLNDPRWARKRGHILARDNYTCRECGGTHRLEVHHKWYDGKPWEVPDSALITLCDICHELRHD